MRCSPQAPSALHPEFLLSCQKEPKARTRLQRPNLRSGFLALLASPGPPKTHSARFARSAQTVGRSQLWWRAGARAWACCAAQRFRTGQQPSSQQPGIGATDGSPGCSAVGCLIWLFPPSAPRRSAQQPGGLRSKLQPLAPTHCLSGVSAANGASLSRPPGCEHCREPRRGGVPGGAVLASFAKTKEARVQGVEPLAGCNAKHHPDR